jgi:hypothetical protein
MARYSPWSNRTATNATTTRTKSRKASADNAYV